jgi:hypothetical protein
MLLVLEGLTYYSRNLGTRYKYPKEKKEQIKLFFCSLGNNEAVPEFHRRTLHMFFSSSLAASVLNLNSYPDSVSSNQMLSYANDGPHTLK